MYPEFYRKSSDHVKGSNEETCEPYCIGYISSILKKKSGEVTLNVNKMYRPENTHRGQTYGQQLDLNLLLWSDEGIVLPFFLYKSAFLSLLQIFPVCV